VKVGAGDEVKCINFEFSVGRWDMKFSEGKPGKGITLEM
jgi:hypothetical protein